MRLRLLILCPCSIRCIDTDMANLFRIGQCWSAAFAFWIIGTVFLVWIMVMASQVNQNQYG